MNAQPFGPPGSGFAGPSPERGGRVRPPAAIQRLPTADVQSVSLLNAVRVGGLRGDARSPPAGRDEHPHWFHSEPRAHKPKPHDALPVFSTRVV
jgi:hypothetical protein